MLICPSVVEKMLAYWTARKNFQTLHISTTDSAKDVVYLQIMLHTLKDANLNMSILCNKVVFEMKEGFDPEDPLDTDHFKKVMVEKYVKLVTFIKKIQKNIF